MVRDTHKDRIVAVGLLTRRDLSLLGPSLSYVWPIEEAPDFDELLRAIDEAESRHSSTPAAPSAPPRRPHD